jgi:hypothetical protein
MCGIHTPLSDVTLLNWYRVEFCTTRAMPAIALRGLFAGAGSAMMSSSLVVDAVLELTKKPDPRDVRLLYLGKLGTNIA